MFHWVVGVIGVVVGGVGVVGMVVVVVALVVGAASGAVFVGTRVVAKVTSGSYALPLPLVCCLTLHLVYMSYNIPGKRTPPNLDAGMASI